MSREFDLVIVGAGVTGAVTAGLAVARRLCTPARVAIVANRFPADPGADADWDLRVYALSRASERVLRDCGVWDEMRADRIYGYERMHVWDASGAPQGRGSLSFDCAEIGEPNLGSIVDARVLQARCLQAARDAGVVLIEAVLENIVVTDAAAHIALGDGRELRCRLIVGADGTESRTRELLGIGTAGHAYHQDALVAHIRTEKPHQGSAWQRFLATGPLAFLPLPDGRSSIVWSTARSSAARLRGVDSGQFGAELTAASGGVFGACELVTPIAGFPLKLQYALNYVAPSAVLLGDAAHVVHPLAGQGLNLGLLDCAALAEVLGSATGAQQFGDMRLLRRYERWRKSENLLAAAAMDGIDRLFSNANPVLANLRSVGLSAVGQLPFVKRQLARRALGLSGDLPSFRADRSSPHR
jgi:2-octaprenylphenol hydroxylase